MASLPNRISTRLSDKDYQKITKLSHQLGKSKAVILRAIINGYNHQKQNLSMKDYTHLYNAIGKLNNLYRIAYRDGNNLNQIAKVENTNGYSSYSPQLLDKINNNFRLMYMLLKQVVTYGSIRYRA